MKKTLIVMLASCVLGLIVGCGSNVASVSGSSHAKPQPTDSTQPAESTQSAEPMDIQLGDEEVEYHGVHLVLPNSVVVDVRDDGVFGYSDSSVPGSGEIGFSMASVSPDYFDVYAESEGYTPELAMFAYSVYFEGADTETTTMDHVMIDGTFALVAHDDEGGSQRTTVNLVLDTEVVSIMLEDYTGNYADVIQQSIDSIQVDDELVPECATRLTPEALSEAGLREQTWLVDDVLYMNVPEGYTLIEFDDGTEVWGSPDGRSYFAATSTDVSLSYATQDVVESIMSAQPGFLEFLGFSSGIQNNMLMTTFAFIDSDSNGDPHYTYTVAVLPTRVSDQEIVINAFLYSDEELELFENMMDTIRFADGWEVNGLVDDEPVPVSEL